MKIPIALLLLLGIVFFAVSIMSRCAWADIAAYTQAGPHVIPIYSKNIAIEEEHLEVTMHVEWSRIRVRMIMKNHGELQELKVGLPQVELCEKELYPVNGPLHQGRQEGLWDISLTVDGKSVPCHLSRGSRARDDENQEKAVFRTDQGTRIEIPVQLGIHEFLDEKYGRAVLNWLSWDLPFQPGQQREISVAYSVENCRYHSGLGLVYLLSTARLWQNSRIKKLTMKAEFDENIGINLLKKEMSSPPTGHPRETPLPKALPVLCRYEVRTVKPGGYQLQERSLSWSLSEFEPENFSIDAVWSAPRP